MDDELVEMFIRPSKDPGALDVFVSVITGGHLSAGLPGPQATSVQVGWSVDRSPLLVAWQVPQALKLRPPTHGAPPLPRPLRPSDS